MKKAGFIIAFALLAMGVFGQELLVNEEITTSNGRKYNVGLQYYGKIGGQQFANRSARNYPRLSSLSNTQFEIINNLLSRYQKAPGDIFLVLIVDFNMEYGVSIICEMTSSSQYIWWAFRLI